MGRLCNPGGIAKIGPSNIKAVEDLFTDPVSVADAPEPGSQAYHLPGDICRTIKKARRGAGAGPFADTLDGFIDLVRLSIGAVNESVRRLFDLLYRALLPEEVSHFMSDSYLFCLLKDPSDHSRLRPIAIPCAVRRLLASHVVAMERDALAMDLLPHQLAVGVKGGMDFIIHAMQLSIDKFIRGPEEHPEQTARGDSIPTRAAVFVDFKNMFNMVSRKVLLRVLRRKYPHLAGADPLPLGERGVAKD
ncbi:hypothetical protein ACHAWF_017709 [Thalassiosira exigua]